MYFNCPDSQLCTLAHDTAFLFSAPLKSLTNVSVFVLSAGLSHRVLPQSNFPEPMVVSLISSFGENGDKSERRRSIKPPFHHFHFSSPPALPQCLSLPINIAAY